MYEYLIGKLVKITPSAIVVDVAGVGYLLSVANPYSWSAQFNQAVTIYVHQVIREDAHVLYGFATEEEKALFLKLIGVTGIGPKSALAIIARDDNDGLVNAIDSNNVTYLMKFPGVGKKTAMQMVLDLAGKFDPEKLPSQKTQANSALEEAMEALMALGYKAAELKKIEKQLETQTEKTAEEYIKLALRLVVK